MSYLREDKVIVAEYSVRNKSYNVTTLEEALRQNQETALKGLLNDYIIIGAFKTYDEADDACQKMQEQQDIYEEEYGFAIDADDEDVYDMEDTYGY